MIWGCKRVNYELPIISNISHCYDGQDKAYIYIWYSKQYKVLYIGQTNDANGTLGRAISHIKKNGTLRVRFEDHTGENLEKAEDLTLISFRLPQSQEFISIETSYREAVEYLVQSKLQKIRGTLNPVLKVISNVRYSDRIAEPLVKKVAEYIIDCFITSYCQSEIDVCTEVFKIQQTPINIV